MLAEMSLSLSHLMDRVNADTKVRTHPPPPRPHTSIAQVTVSSFNDEQDYVRNAVRIVHGPFEAQLIRSSADADEAARRV